MSDSQSGARIVVGVDGSDLSVDALRWAVRQARLTHAEVDAVAAWEVSNWVFLAPTFTEQDYEREAERLLDEAVAKVLDDEPDIPVLKHMVHNRPGLALTHTAKGADLLVIGSHGRGELPGVHLGSVASYCVHHAPCPVLVVRGAKTGR